MNPCIPVPPVPLWVLVNVHQGAWEKSKQEHNAENVTWTEFNPVLKDYIWNLNMDFNVCIVYNLFVYITY